MGRCPRPPRPGALCSQFALYPQNADNLDHLLTQNWYFPQVVSHQTHFTLKSSKTHQVYKVFTSWRPLPSFTIGTTENGRRGRKSTWGEKGRFLQKFEGLRHERPAPPLPSPLSKNLRVGKTGNWKNTATKTLGLPSPRRCFRALCSFLHVLKMLIRLRIYLLGRGKAERMLMRWRRRWRQEACCERRKGS